MDIPDQKTNGMFDRFARKTFNQIDVLQRKNLNLRKTRDRLLPKLIGGEIDIENLDIKQNNLEGKEGLKLKEDYIVYQKHEG